MDLLNKVMIVGNLTRDPELRQTGNGKSVAELTLALDPPGGGDRNRTQTGNREAERPPARGAANETIFVDVVLWERNAENAAEYLKKGSPVLIEGRLRMDSWEDKATGKPRRKLMVAGDRMRFLNLGGGRSERDRDRDRDRDQNRDRERNREREQEQDNRGRERNHGSGNSHRGNQSPHEAAGSRR